MAAKTAAQSIIPIRMAWRAFTTLERKGLVIMGGKCTRLGTGPRRIAVTQVRSAVAGVFSALFASLTLARFAWVGRVPLGPAGVIWRKRGSS